MVRSACIGALVSFAMFLIMLTPAVAVTSAIGPSAGIAPAEPDQGPSLVFSSHGLTYDEMAALRNSIGVRDPERNYNEIVDGHGTGFAPPTAEQWDLAVGQLKVVDSAESALAASSSFDFSTSPSFPTVGNQAMQGSCSAWASTYYSFGYMEALDYGWTDPKTGATDHLFSPAWTYNKVNGGRDSGSWMIDNFYVIRDWGAASMATMPYDDSDYLSWGSSEAFREAPPHSLVEGYALAYSGPSAIDSIKALLVADVPVSFAMDANEYSSGFGDGNYIISSAEYDSTTLNHAQTFVGYDDSVADDGDVGAFRVVNSWGASWGDSGYYWLTYDAVIELGNLGVLTMNFLSDAIDYAPSIVGVWHFNEAPTRSAIIEVGVGTSSSPVASKVPYYNEDRSTSHTMPTFMCLDMSEFDDVYDSGTDDFYLDLTGSSRGVTSSFRIELYSGDYTLGAAIQASGQSPDVPKSVPGTVTNSLPYYDPIDVSSALDSSVSVADPLTSVRWVGVDHHSVADGDSMQSGDVGDSESTSLSVSVDGPVDVSFDWKVSSESLKDVLSFSVPDTAYSTEISGDVDWTTVSCSLPAGSHELEWTYSKDSADSMLEDCAWVDGLALSYVTSPPVIVLVPSYDAILGQEFVVTPAEVSDPDGDLESVWYDWGDGTSMTMGDPAEGYSASHTYGELSGFELNAYAEDAAGNNVSDSATVLVSESNSRPAISSFDVDGAKDYYSPGETVRFNATVVDDEGDLVEVTIDFGDGSAAESLSYDTDAGVAAYFVFEHAFSYGGDSTYAVTVEAADDAAHSVDWLTRTLSVLVNTLPECVLVADPLIGSLLTSFSFDASGSSDAETAAGDLVVRWDWNGDGSWDTDWSSDMTVTHVFSTTGTHTVVCEVEDGAGLSSVDQAEIEVADEAIPEFSLVVVPVVIMLVVFLMARRKTQ